MSKKVTQYWVQVGERKFGVSEREYIDTERNCGFHRKDDLYKPATSSFSNGTIKGWTELVELPPAPHVEDMESLPPMCNPMHYDSYHMGCDVSGGWMAMYDQHAGYAREGTPYPDPDYLIFVNTHTGQRFRLVFPTARSIELGTYRRIPIISYELASAARRLIENRTWVDGADSTRSADVENFLRDLISSYELGSKDEKNVWAWEPFPLFEMCEKYKFELQLKPGKRFYRLALEGTGTYREMILDAKLQQALVLDSRLFSPAFDARWADAADKEDAILRAVAQMFWPKSTTA